MHRINTDIIKHQPLVTLYILNYNYKDYIEQCIDSVLSQTYENLEVIIIDDGSTDGSISVISNYQKNHSEKLQTIFQDNIGLIKSIIRAFELSNGEYVVRVDADDWVKPNFVEELVKAMLSDKQLAMVFPDYYEVDEYGHITKRIKRYDFSSEVSLLDQPAHGACSLIRKKMYDEVGGHNKDLQCQDGVDIWLALTEKYKVKNLKQPLFYYRQHSASLTTDFTKILRNRAAIYKDHAIRRGFISADCTAFMPIRSDVVHGNEFVFKEISGKKIIDWSIDKFINSQELTKLIISTDSEQIINKFQQYQERCRSSGKDAYLHIRSKKTTKKGSSIDCSIADYCIRNKDQAISNIVILTPLNPFTNYMYVDSAIYYAFIYGVDVVDSVIENNSMLYFHDGGGLVLLGDSKIRHERDNVYVRKGGITFYSQNKVDSILNNDNTFGNSGGHIVVDKYHAYEIKNNMDLQIANTISLELQLFKS